MGGLSTEVAFNGRELAEERGATVSAEVPDWTRERPRRFWDPGRKLLLALRHYQHWRDKGGPLSALFCKWAALRHRMLSVVTGADIPL